MPLPGIPVSTQERPIMPRPKQVHPTVQLELKLDPDLWSRVTALLYSDLEQRVPQGCYKAFFEARIREHFDWKELDLAPFAGTPPGQFCVRGHPQTIVILERLLKGELSL